MDAKTMASHPCRPRTPPKAVCAQVGGWVGPPPSAAVRASVVGPGRRLCHWPRRCHAAALMCPC